MHLTLIQSDIIWENKEKNFRKIESLVNQVKTPHTDLIILPELFATGYTMNPTPFAENLQGPTRQFLAKIAKKYQTNILGSFIEKTAKKPKNTAVIVSPQNKILLHYSKIHLPTFLQENKHYQRGKNIPFFEYKKNKIAVVICYDLRFPELFRNLVKKGVKMIIVIANWPDLRIDHWNLFLKMRAIENQIYIVGVNRKGKSKQDSYSGYSQIIAPNGEIISNNKNNDKSIIFGNIDFSFLEKQRKQFSFVVDMMDESFL